MKEGVMKKDKTESRKTIFDLFLNDKANLNLKLSLGIDIEAKTLRIDNGEIISLDELNSAYCVLEKVTLRTFYIKGYFLQNDYEITKLLYDIGLINKRKKFYTVSNYYNSLQTFKNGVFHKDLFHPIKRLSGFLFHGDEYKIKDFRVINASH